MATTPNKDTIKKLLGYLPLTALHAAPAGTAVANSL